MSFGQEIKDFISAFKTGSDAVNSSERITDERKALDAQTEYMAARANALNSQTASLNTNVPNPASQAGEAGAASYDAQGSTPRTPAVPIGDNPKAKEAYNYFTQQGWTPAAAAGIVGNLATESSFGDDVISGARSGDPSVSNKGLQGQYATGSHFLAQWNGDRLAGLLQMTGGKTPTFQQQLAYVNQELTTGVRKNVGAQLQGVNDPSKAAAIAMGFEGPHGYTPGGDPTKVIGWQKRLGYAQDAYAKFGNGTPGQSTGQTQTASATPTQPLPDDASAAPKTAIPTSSGAGSTPSGNSASTPPAPSIPLVQVNTNPIGMKTAVPVPNASPAPYLPPLDENVGVDPNTGEPLDDQQPTQDDQQ